MFYKKYKPSKPLKNYVAAYYIWESSGSLTRPFSITSPATYCSAMVFNYGHAYRLYNHLHDGVYLPGQFLSGPSTGSYTLQLKGKIGMAGIIFRGAAFRGLFQTPNPADFLDDRIDLCCLIGQEAAEVAERLEAASSHIHRIQILEAFLLKRLTDSQKDLTIADRASSLILRNRGMIRMDDLARQLYISPRQLRRTFKEWVGINPKYFARSKRFSYVNLCLTRNPKISWRAFIREDAFYDQSHFIKDYQEFFGKKPSFQIPENRQVATMLSS